MHGGESNTDEDNETVRLTIVITGMMFMMMIWKGNGDGNYCDVVDGVAIMIVFYH